MTLPKNGNGDCLDQLRKDQQLNPWLAMAPKWLKILDERPLSTKDIMLVDGEKERIAKYQEHLRQYRIKKERQMKYADYKIFEHVLPCPCVGSPVAPIWLMLKNPGMNGWDWYDLVSVQEGRTKISGDLRSNVRPFDNCTDEKDALRKRQQYLVRQMMFDFEQGSFFYVFEDVFKTFIKKCKCACGSYDWYERFLFPSNGLFEYKGRDIRDFASSNLFVLDYHPYHSKSFFAMGMDDIKTPYWDVLVQYAFDMGKLMIFWGSKVLEKIRVNYENEYVSAVKKKHVVVLRGPSASCSIKMADFPVGDNYFVKRHVKNNTNRFGDAVCRWNKLMIK